VQAVLRRAMAKDPAQRPADAAAMIRDLEAAQRGQTPGVQVFGRSGVQTPAPPSSGPLRPAPNAQPSPDPFAALRPDDLVLPQRYTGAAARRPARPWISPATRAWMSALVLSVLAAALVLGVVWGTMIAYQSHQSNANRQAALAQSQMALKSYERGDYDRAMREFLRAAELSPGSPIGRQARRNAVNSALSAGVARQNRRDLSGAESGYMAALRIDPENAQAYASLALLQYEAGRRPQAFAYWDRALMLWHDQITRGALDADEMRDARQGLQRAEQNYAATLIPQADLLYSQRRIGEAIQIWQRVLQVAPGSRWAVIAQDNLNRVGTGGMGIFPSYMGATP
jgi:tetratricopeptide (TPR) repeat protein